MFCVLCGAQGYVFNPLRKSVRDGALPQTGRPEHGQARSLHRPQPGSGLGSGMWGMPRPPAAVAGVPVVWQEDLLEITEHRSALEMRPGSLKPHWGALSGCEALCFLHSDSYTWKDKAACLIRDCRQVCERKSEGECLFSSTWDDSPPPCGSVLLSIGGGGQYLRAVVGEQLSCLASPQRHLGIFCHIQYTFLLLWKIVLGHLNSHPCNLGTHCK